jgi:hypothetical protein
MKAQLTFSIEKHKEIIDLEEYGYESDVTWEDLSEDEKNTVRDSATEQMHIQCDGDNYSYED